MSQGQTTLVELSEALQHFAASPRFNFLKTLQVGRFIGSTPISLGILGEFTFEKLVELGTKKIAKLKWLNREQESLLVTLLEALSEGDSGELFCPPPPISPQIREAADDSGLPEHTEEILSSVQVEIDLRDRLQALKRHPDFETLRLRSLGYFWDPTWPRAPFEESFTLEQLTELDMSTLFRKRTMTSSRIRYMTKALDRALGRKEESPAPESTGAEPSIEPITSHAPPTPLMSSHALTSNAPAWRGCATSPSPHESVVLESFLEACSKARESSRPLERALSDLPGYLSGDEFLALLESKPLDARVCTAVRRWLGSPAVEQATKPLAIMLQGPGVALPAIAELFVNESFRGAYALLAAHVVVRVLGAREVSVSNSVCKGVWSLNPDAVGFIVENLRGTRSSSVRDSLRSVCPVLDPILQTWLYGIVQPSKRKKSPRKVRRTRKR
jgi:hypothetical protein